MYPILYLDAIVLKIRDNHTVINKAAHIALGVDLEGRKQVLGIWLEQNEGAKFWLGVLTELRNRGVVDVLIACCDGLTGFPDAIEAVWPHATVQTCVVHLVRSSMKYCSYKDRKKVVADLKSIYKAPTVDSAADALDAQETPSLTKRRRKTLAIFAVSVVVMAAGVARWLTSRPHTKIVASVCGTQIEASVVDVVPGVILAPTLGQAARPDAEFACAIL